MSGSNAWRDLVKMGEPADVHGELAKIDPVLMVSVREVCDCMPLGHFTLV